MKIVKYALLGIGALALLFGAVLAYVAATFNPNDYKPQIIQLVKEKKERTLKLDGDIKLSFWPNVGAELGKVSLSEAKSEKEFAAVDNARVSVKVMPLFSKQMVVDEVRVKGARAAIVRFKDGKLNIDDLLAKDDKEPKQDVAFDIAEVDIADSAFSFRDEQKGAQYALSKVNLKTGRIANNVPTKVDLSVTVQASQPKVNLATELKTKLTFDLDKQVYVLDGMSLEAKGEAADIRNFALKATGSVTAKPGTNEFTAEKLAVAMTGVSGKDNLDVKLDAPKLVLTKDKATGDKVTVVAKVTGPQSALNANVSLPGVEGSAKAFKSSAMTLDLDMKQGDLTVKAKVASPVSGNLESRQVNLSNLAANLTVSGPDVPGKSLTGELKGSAAVDAAKESAQANLAGKIADSNIKARLGIGGGKTTGIHFDVDVDQLDVDRYFPPAPAGQQQKQTEKPFDLTGLRNLNANGTIRIGSLKANNLKATNVRVDVKAGGGRVELNPLTANLYQGTLASAVTVNAAPATPTFAAKHKMNGVSVGPFLKDLANNDTLEGKGNVTLDVTTQGNTAGALKKALNGNAGLKLTDGAVKGIDIAGSIRSAKAKLGTLKGEQTQQADKSQKTDFSEMTGTFAIKNGVARNNDLSIKSPLLRVGGEGDINIGEDSLNYLVKASVVGTSKGQGGRDLDDLKGLTVPVRLSGPLTSPKYTIDFGAMMTDVAKQKVEERLTSEIGKRLGGGAAAGGTASKDAAAKDAGKSSGSRPQDVLKGLFGR
ncbi:MAG TPA: AsmA family protein [Burkholderiales bacterium]|jgi:AsmA protein|nr:AsmA family protein [Burkholderiales bacterium]